MSESFISHPLSGPIHQDSIYPITGITHEDASSNNTIPDINVWIIIITAVIFYAVLSWYNFFLASYNYITGNNPDKIENLDQENLKIVGLTFGFAIFWTIVAIGLYTFLAYKGMLSYPKQNKMKEQPGDRENSRSKSVFRNVETSNFFRTPFSR